jgi:hypothetical protein
MDVEQEGQVMGAEKGERKREGGRERERERGREREGERGRERER